MRIVWFVAMMCLLLHYLTLPFIVITVASEKYAKWRWPSIGVAVFFVWLGFTLLISVRIWRFATFPTTP